LGGEKSLYLLACCCVDITCRYLLPVCLNGLCKRLCFWFSALVATIIISWMPSFALVPIELEAPQLKVW
jgi:hypothetical protein